MVRVKMKFIWKQVSSVVPYLFPAEEACIDIVNQGNRVSLDKSRN